MKNISRVLRYLADYKGKVALYFLCSILSALFATATLAMLGPVLQVLFKGEGAPVAVKRTDLLGRLTSYINEQTLMHSKLDVLLFICIAVVLFTLLKNLFFYLSAYLLNPIRNAVLRRLRNDMFVKMLSLPIGFFTEERKGDLVSRMTNDVNEVELSIMGTLEAFIREPLNIIFSLVYMLMISIPLTLFMLLVLPVAGLVIGRIGRSLRKSSGIVQKQMGVMLGIIDETLAGMRVVKAFNAEKHQHLRFMEINNLDFRARNSNAVRREMGSPSPRPWA